MILQPFRCKEASLPEFAWACSPSDRRVFDLFLTTWADGALALADERGREWIGEVADYPPWARQLVELLAFPSLNEGPCLPILPPGVVPRMRKGVPFDGSADPEERLEFSLASDWFRCVATSRAAVAETPRQVITTLRQAAYMSERVEIFDRYFGSRSNTESSKRLLAAVLASPSVRQVHVQCFTCDEGVAAPELTERVFATVDRVRSPVRRRLVVSVAVDERYDPHTHDRFLLFQQRSGAARLAISLGKGTRSVDEKDGGHTTVCRLPSHHVERIRRACRSGASPVTRIFD